MRLAFVVAVLATMLTAGRPNVQLPELVVQRGNGAAALAVAIDRSGHLIASTSIDGIYLWDRATGRMLRRLSIEGTGVVGFSHDGKYLLDGIHLFDVGTGAIVRSLPPAGLGYDVAKASFSASSDGRWLLSVAANNQIPVNEQIATFWDLRTPGFPARSVRIEHAGPPESAVPTAFGSDGMHFFTADGFGIYERDLQTGVIDRTMDKPDYSFDVNGSGVFALSPDGHFALAATNSGDFSGDYANPDRATTGTAKAHLYLIDIRSGRVARQWDNDFWTTAATFSGDSRTAAAMEYGAGVSFVKTTPGGSEQSFSSPGITAATLNPAGDVMLGATESGQLLADGSTPSGSDHRSGDIFTLNTHTGARHDVWENHVIDAIAISPDRHWLATCTRTRVIVWDLTTGQPAYFASAKFPLRNALLAFSPDSRRLAYRESDGVRVWDVPTWTMINWLPRPADVFPTQIFFIGDGTKLLLQEDGLLGSAPDSQNASILIADLPTNDVSIKMEHVREPDLSATVNSMRFQWVEDKHYDEHLMARTFDAATGQSADVASISPSAVFLSATKLVAPGGRYALIDEEPPAGPTFYDLRSGGAARKAGVVSFPGMATASFQTFSPDGRIAAFSDFNNALLLVSVPSGKVIQHIPATGPRGDWGRYTVVTFSVDHKLLITSVDDSTINLWDVERGTALGTLFLGAAESNDWLVASPNGLFDGSPRGWSEMLWRFNGATFDVVPGVAYLNDFFQPGLLSDLVSGKHPTAKRSLPRLDRRLPRISISATGGSQYERHVRVRVHVSEAAPDAAHHSGSGVRDVRLLRNGSLVKLWPGDVLHGRANGNLFWDVTFVAGANEISAYAFNADNVRSETTARTYRSALPARKGVARILAIGVDATTNADLHLSFARADAASFADKLADVQGRLGRFGRTEVTRLYRNRQPTKEAILRALHRLAVAAQPEDAIFVYIASHGLASDDHFYMVPYDTGYTKPLNTQEAYDRIAAHAVSDRDLAAQLLGADAQEIVLIIDACQSGQALGDPRNVGPMNSKGLAQLAFEKGMYILAASRGDQDASEDPLLKHGILTYELLNALKPSASRGTSSGQELYMRQWFAIAQARVPERHQKDLDMEHILPVLQPPLQRPRVFAPEQRTFDDFPVARL